MIARAPLVQGWCPAALRAKASSDDCIVHARALFRRLYQGQARRKVQGRGVDMVRLALLIGDMIFLLKSLRCHLSVQNVLGRNNACAGKINALAGLAAEFLKTPLHSLQRLWFGFFEETDLRHGGSFFPNPATLAVVMRL